MTTETRTSNIEVQVTVNDDGQWKMRADDLILLAGMFTPDPTRDDPKLSAVLDAIRERVQADEIEVDGYRGDGSVDVTIRWFDRYGQIHYFPDGSGGMIQNRYVRYSTFEYGQVFEPDVWPAIARLRGYKPGAFAVHVGWRERPESMIHPPMTLMDPEWCMPPCGSTMEAWVILANERRRLEKEHLA
jgi:hypothetical protein